MDGTLCLWFTLFIFEIAINIEPIISICIQVMSDRAAYRRNAQKNLAYHSRQKFVRKQIVKTNNLIASSTASDLPTGQVQWLHNYRRELKSALRRENDVSINQPCTTRQRRRRHIVSVFVL